MQDSFHQPLGVINLCGCMWARECAHSAYTLTHRGQQHANVHTHASQHAQQHAAPHTDTRARTHTQTATHSPAQGRAEVRMRAHTHDVVLAEVPAGPRSRGGYRRHGDMPPNNIGTGVADMTPLLHGKTLRGRKAAKV